LEKSQQEMLVTIGLDPEPFSLRVWHACDPEIEVLLPDGAT